MSIWGETAEKANSMSVHKSVLQVDVVFERNWSRWLKMPPGQHFVQFFNVKRGFYRKKGKLLETERSLAYKVRSQKVLCLGVGLAGGGGGFPGS